MKNWKSLTLVAAMLAATLMPHAAHAQSPQPTPNSAKSSPSSATRANKSEPPASAGGTTSSINQLNGQPRRNNLGAVPPAYAGGSDRNAIAACMATAVELEKTRTLAVLLETENRSLTERLTTEKAATALLTELNETRHSESAALKTTIAAKNETIAAKDVAIASQDKLVEALRKKKPSPWRRLGDILIGAAAIAVIR